MPVFKDGQNEIAYEMLGPEDGRVILWAHGWGQSRSAFMPLASSLEKMGRHILVDFPGFGQSPPPAAPWGTENYADAMARFILSEIKKPVIWAGHSFGCRVGLQIAARHPDMVNGLFLVAAAGLPRKRSFLSKVSHKARVMVFKFLKKIVPSGLVKEEWLYKKFGSADYRNAGAMRAILVKTVNEDLSAVARRVKCPVMLVYGSGDAETPPEIGKRLKKLIPNSDLAVIDGLDHYSVLGAGRHQIAPLLKRFMETHS